MKHWRLGTLNHEVVSHGSGGWKLTIRKSALLVLGPSAGPSGHLVAGSSQHLLSVPPSSSGVNNHPRLKCICMTVSNLMTPLNASACPRTSVSSHSMVLGVRTEVLAWEFWRDTILFIQCHLICGLCTWSCFDYEDTDMEGDSFDTSWCWLPSLTKVELALELEELSASAQMWWLESQGLWLTLPLPPSSCWGTKKRHNSFIMIPRALKRTQRIKQKIFLKRMKTWITNSGNTYNIK